MGVWWGGDGVTSEGVYLKYWKIDRLRAWFPRKGCSCSDNCFWRWLASFALRLENKRRSIALLYEELCEITQFSPQKCRLSHDTLYLTSKIKCRRGIIMRKAPRVHCSDNKISSLGDSSTLVKYDGISNRQTIPKLKIKETMSIVRHRHKKCNIFYHTWVCESPWPWLKLRPYAIVSRSVGIRHELRSI
jgi:hypothetical protein